MPVQIKYDPRYKPSPEVLRLLELSWLEVEKMENGILNVPSAASASKVCMRTVPDTQRSSAGSVNTKAP